ncbi:uncharacterized protein LOC100167274 isoform X2 [Acyrthosiphon pisum]|uniref:THAP-type domain-containing protein n=1 Tax=Acyrthosiphon pisum TaxID=7029 RepID=A0A8R2B5H9_ACYPI|nr:uncharacterized protein LOC100167274 isoform X2 [Acyrthosiphon pisum]|eukprot:XP_008182620.1 PREDICTED: uncharacterized protein LOC100167274 isoform X2 [Acyrthosiphon pisum]
MHRRCCFFCQTSALKVPGLILHNFPKDLSLRNIWLKRCGYTEEEFFPYNKLCSLHFDGNSYKNTKLRKLLKNNAIPTKFKKISKFNFVECEQSSSKITMKVSDQTVECKQSSSEMTINVADQTVECEQSISEMTMNMSEQIECHQSSSEMTMDVSVQRKNNSNFVNTRLHYLMLAVECELSRLGAKINMSDQTVEYEQSSSEMTMNVLKQTVECEQSSSEMTINVSVESRGVISTF